MKKYNIWFLIIIVCLGITIQDSFGYSDIRRFGGTPSDGSNGERVSKYKKGPYHNPYKYNNPETDVKYADEYKKLQEKKIMEYNLSNLSYEEKRFAKMMGFSLSSNEEIEKFKIKFNKISSIEEIDSSRSSLSNVLLNTFCLNLLATHPVDGFQYIYTSYEFYYKDSLEKNDNKEVNNVMFSFNFGNIIFNGSGFDSNADYSCEYKILYRENIIKFHQWLILINSKMNEFIDTSKSINISNISKEYNIKNDFSIVYVKNLNKEYISSEIIFLNARFKVFSDRNEIYYISEFYDNDSGEVIFSCDLNGLKNLVKITNIKIADKKIKLKK